MVEAGAKEVTEAQVVGALEAAHAAIKQLVAVIEDLKASIGKKLAVAAKTIAPEFYREIEDKTLQPLTEAMRIKQKLESYAQVDAARREPAGVDS